MKIKLQVASCRLQVPCRRRRVRLARSFGNRKSEIGNGFTLVEVMVAMVLLTLIVAVLMAVFNSTQAAFRNSVNQAGVLQDGRATMNLIAGDLRAMAPSDGYYSTNPISGAANFYATVASFPTLPSPLRQPMVGGNSVRTNVLENIFILGRGNQNGVPVWTGVGYAVTTNGASGSLYALYRFATNYPAALGDPGYLFWHDYSNFLAHAADYSHLMDGVVSLTVQPCDPNGYGMTSRYQWEDGQWVTNQNVLYFPPQWGHTGFIMFSNTVPASVQVEMGVLEDRALQRAASLSASVPAQARYLEGSAGRVHVFRQRVWIPNADPSAYQ